VLLVEDADGERAVAYAQFGPLSGYPRALRLRELYPRLPQSPLPAVITCVAVAARDRGRGHAMALVEAICADLAGRGFAAVEAYPEIGPPPDATSAPTPAFWERAGFAVVVADERYPVVRREL
jgi:ribosomal protein S18 acetylase RimI-like enzyme